VRWCNHKIASNSTETSLALFPEDVFVAATGSLDAYGMTFSNSYVVQVAELRHDFNLYVAQLSSIFNPSRLM
jgi:hypothetical protein